jgi:SAM-dependent methyltransferase
VPAGGSILDVACGAGRHLALGQDRGYRMTGIDRDLSRLAVGIRSAGIELIEADLEDGRPWPLGDRRFDGVIVTNYLWRPILPAIVASVAAGGVLIYETFAAGNERFGRPKNPDFLLRPHELIDAVRPALTVIAYEHLQLDAPSRMVQRVAGVRER